MTSSSMANFLQILSSHLAIFFILSSFSIILISGENHGFARTLNKNVHGLKKEKLSHFRVFFHDIVSGPKPTAIRVVPPVSNYSSTTSFGFMSMIDDPLTEGPEMSSKLVGRAQGMYASAAQEEIGLLMIMNFAFIEGKYNGSTISILGRNKVYPKVREMAVIGGSGLFRYARGYVQASTHKFDKITGDAVVKYNIYVLHY